MSLLKNTLLMVFFVYAMYWGGLGTQSDSTFAQGMGFISVIIALCSLFLFYKLIPKVFGSYTLMSAVLIICLYIAYCLGFLKPQKIAGFLTEQNNDVTTEVAANNTSARQNSGIINRTKNWLFGDNTDQALKFQEVNPFEHSSISGYARVITGSMLNVRGIHIKLFGIAAPELDQTCENKYGEGYYCGQEAVTWLQNWINNREVKCYILGEVINNKTTGICFVNNDKYDIAAVITKAGWAVAYTQNTQMYVPYEQEAASKHKGLWQGEFYYPWDWVKIQNRRVEIVVEKAKSPSSDWKFDFKSLKRLF